MRVLGAWMDLVKSAEVFHFISEKIASGQKTIVANHNLHSIHLMQRNADLRAFFEKADLIEVDSIPLIAWARFIGRPSRRFHRCTYLDWRREFWDQASTKGWRVFFVGGKEGVGEQAAEHIRQRCPRIHLGTYHGYFDLNQGSPGNEAVLQEIAAFQPDVLLVGMGMPRQELWILDNFDHLPVCAILPVGGAFDYEAGVQTPAPRWIGQLGAEWIFRLVSRPSRMFARYCVEPWALSSAALHDILGFLGQRFRYFNRRSSSGGFANGAVNSKASRA